MIHKAYLLSAFNIGWHIQNIALISIVVLMVTLLVYMLFYMFRKSLHEKKHGRWRLISDQLIQNALFLDEDELGADALIPVPSGTRQLIKNKHFRKLLIDEIMSAKRSISGASSDNLNRLYQQLELDKYALHNIKSRKWHVKAKAIQELTVMEMKDHVNHLFSYTNDQNEHVRMEAQTALVQFNGFEGLAFLDTITHPISDWQQIKLLQQLSLVQAADFDMDSWFKSPNNCVVVFALRLARKYNRFETHSEIVTCLDHADDRVRLESISCLTEIYTEETSDHLISRFLKENLKQQVAMIKAMQSIGTERDILFLLDLLTHENDEIKMHAARALAKTGNKGMQSLEGHATGAGHDHPIKEIVMHIKGELAA